MTACLLIHGYMGTPFEMEPLAAPLEDLGLAVRLVTLPGHDSSADEFRRTGFPEWAARAEEEYDRLAAEYDDIIVIGFSLGGALALRLAEERRPRGVVTLAAPVFPPKAWPAQLRDWLGVFRPGKKLWRPHRPEAQSVAPWRGYKNVVHPPHFYSMYNGFGEVRKKLGLITAPVLVIHDAGDKIVNARNAAAIAEGVSSGRVESHISSIKEERTVRHIITTHRETRADVINRVRAFVADLCGLPAPADWPGSSPRGEAEEAKSA